MLLSKYDVRINVNTLITQTLYYTIIQSHKSKLWCQAKNEIEIHHEFMAKNCDIQSTWYLRENKNIQQQQHINIINIINSIIYHKYISYKYLMWF